MIEAKCSRKKPSQMRQSASVPCSITFISAPGMHAGVVGQRQLQDVIEIVGQHRLALAVRQPVGMQRDEQRCRRW